MKNYRLGSLEFAVGQYTSAAQGATSNAAINVSTGLRSPVFGLANLTASVSTNKKKHGTHTIAYFGASSSYAQFSVWSPRAGTSATSLSASYVSFTWMAFEE
jgi:hypothetical protein